MVNIKYIIIIIMFLVFNSCGQLGNLQQYKFPVKKEIVDSAVSKFYINNPDYLPQGKWKEIADDYQQSATFLKFYFLYLKDSQKMLIYKFTNDSASWQSDNYCLIGLITIVNYNKKLDKADYYIEGDDRISDEEVEKVKKMFENKFLDKLRINYKKLSFWERNDPANA